MSGVFLEAIPEQLAVRDLAMDVTTGQLAMHVYSTHPNAKSSPNSTYSVLPQRHSKHAHACSPATHHQGHGSAWETEGLGGYGNHFCKVHTTP